MNLFDNIEERGNEHPVAIFVIVASVVFGLLFLVAQATSSSEGKDLGGGNPPVQAMTPAGGGGAAPAALPAVPEALPVAAVPAAPAPAVEVPVEVPAAAPAEAPAAVVAPPTAPPPPVSASAYAIVEQSCGALAFGSNEHERLAPASLTKIVTSLLVAKSANLSDMVTVQVSGSQMRKQGSSVMGIEPGQTFSMQDLLYGLMLPSGNDAAMAIAQHLGGGDVNRFVEMMNEEARQLGMVDSHFSNPHGLDSRDLYSSVYDMAIAGRAALDVPLLAQVSTTRNWTTKTGLAFRNGNKLLTSYPGAYGVKIGYTNAAKQTIVAAAERNGRAVIVSVFGSDDRYADSAALLDWTFAHVPARC